MNKISIPIQNCAILFPDASYCRLQAIKSQNEKVGVNFEQVSVNYTGRQRQPTKYNWNKPTH